MGTVHEDELEEKVEELERKIERRAREYMASIDNLNEAYKMVDKLLTEERKNNKYLTERLEALAKSYDDLESEADELKDRLKDRTA